MIELQEIDFAYKKGAVALDGVTATIMPGINLLMGENGAGKTTLLRIMAGLLRPDAGRCLIDGCNVALRRPSVMSRVFFLGDDTSFPAGTINVMADIHGSLYPGMDRTMLADNLRMFGMSGNEPLDDMSLGMRRKAQLAYALALRTDLLLLDEPANGLDIQSKQAFARMLASDCAPGQTVLISTHTVGDLENMFDGVAIMSHGRMRLVASLDDVAERLSFVVSPRPVEGAMVQRISAGRYHAIVSGMRDDADGNSLPIDLTLLYEGVMGPAGESLINEICINR